MIPLILFVLSDKESSVNPEIYRTIYDVRIRSGDNVTEEKN